MYIIYVNHDSVIKQICQLRDKAFLINETGCTFFPSFLRPRLVIFVNYIVHFCTCSSELFLSFLV